VVVTWFLENARMLCGLNLINIFSNLKQTSTFALYSPYNSSLTSNLDYCPFLAIEGDLENIKLRGSKRNLPLVTPN
jgi:hypothetical protein